MCGIAGFIAPPSGETPALLSAMLARLVRRGPDDQGAWFDADRGVALGHRRLSILDLSPQGHQPMLSACGRYVIIFNGEIYNHLELRQDLAALNGTATPVWRGHSDTETLLAAIVEWGIEGVLTKSVGMFAFALWDRQTQALTLARDRLGEKPLYYGRHGNTFLFASELKALKEHPAFRPEINRDALVLYLRHNCIPAPYSIYRGIFKLPPGTFVTIGAGLEVRQPIAYWSVSQIVEAGQTNMFAGTEAEALNELEGLLRQSIRGQMLADVPLGAFLSGGVDSSLVVSLMQAEARQPVKTFTIGFDEPGYNEAEYAAAVAKHLGTDHTELYVTSQEAMAMIPHLPEMYDEPFSDSSQIPTWLVSKLAREKVTVSLSGDGGDELFGGYNRYFLGQSIWDKLSRVPLPIRDVVARLAIGVKPDQWNKMISVFATVLPKELRFGNPGDKIHKLAGVMRADSLESLYLGLISHWNQPSSIVLGGVEPPTKLTDRNQWPAVIHPVERLMALDTMTYLPDDILTKVDRAAMDQSLETRVPFLDHRVVEFAWRLPLSMKLKNGQGKHLLRQVLYRHVPKELIERPKMGFGIPLDSWLRGPLREWAESLLAEKRVMHEGFFDPVAVRGKWEEHLTGRRNWQYQIWDILVFQAWLENEMN